MFNLAIMEMQNFRAAVLFCELTPGGAFLILQRHSAHYVKIFNEGRLRNLQLPALYVTARQSTRVCKIFSALAPFYGAKMSIARRRTIATRQRPPLLFAKSSCRENANRVTNFSL